MLLKSTLREIKSSLGRFLAIMAIIALGVGFFGGLKVTKPSMIRTLNDYLDEHQFYDFRLLSTIGFEEEDVDELREKLMNADAVEDIASDSTAASNNDILQSEVTALEPAYFIDALCAIDGASESPYRLHSITSEVNTLWLIEGRMPTSPDECVVDNYMADIRIGGTVTITENNEEDTLDMLNARELKVVGIVRSPLYINFERGNTSIGTGKLTSFIYVLPEEFDTDYYMEVYVRMRAGSRYGVYTDEYDHYIDTFSPQVEDVLTSVVDGRYERVKGDAQAEIDDARKELEDKKAEAEQELADAKKKLEDGAKEIEDHQKEIDDGKEEIEKAKRTLTSKQREINDNRAPLEEKMAQLKAAKTAAELAGSAGATTDASGLAALANTSALTAQRMSASDYIFAYAQIESGLTRLDAGQKELDKARATLKEKEQELLDGEKELNDARKELEDGRKEYDDAVADFNKEIADAEEKLADAQKELDDVENPDIYCLDRSANVGYASFESNSDIVASVANVFPIFFFAVAVLICMTTMNRMVEEQRVQIGILKALGYSPASIMMKYLFYAGTAALTGAVGGYILGTRLLPVAIWQGYNIMYNMGPTVTYQPVPVICISSIAAALICAFGSAYYSVIHELKEVPANLIRPKSPKSGKRVFLEYITPLWKRMKFLHKVSARNIIRYKKRFFMMVLGIGGCTALVLTGFGIGDSIKGIADLQFDNIQIYDETVTFSGGLNETDMEEVAAIDGVKDIVFMHQEAIDITANGVTKSVTAVSPAHTSDLEGFLVTRELESGEAIPYPTADGVILVDNIANLMGVSKNDIIVIRDADMNELEARVDGVTENHFSGFVYMPEGTSITGEAVEYNSAWLHLEEGFDPHEVASRISKRDDVMDVSVMTDLKLSVNKMMAGMDFIVLVVIMCAGALAFIVLYNLTNINITERVREIATIKVLGFYSNETAQYVFRENIILTAIGALVGLPLGQALHSFIMYTIKIDMVSFLTYIAPMSYVWAILLTFAFAIVVNFFMMFKLAKINMAESLKSIE